MTDQELDRALADALDVEPRADFQARVRQRVAAEPPPSRWLAPWQMTGGVAAVALVAVAVTFWNGADEQPGTTIARAPVAREVAITPGAAPAEAVVPATATARVVGRTAPPAPVIAALPAPMISSDDARLVDLLAASARSGIVADLLSPADDAGGALELAALSVPLLGAEKPIEMNVVDAGERQ